MSKLEITTKIGRRNAVNGSANGKNKQIPDKKVSSVNVDRVTISDPSKFQAPANKSKVITSEIRHELVNKFRSVLESGTYEVKANDIADKIVQKIRESKNRLVL